MSDPAGATEKPAAGNFAAVLDRLREKKRQALSGWPGEIAPARPDPTDAPLSFAQQRLWFLAQLRPNDASYNVSAVVELRGRIHVAALEDAFRRVVLRHEALRTTFTAVEGQPVQRVRPCTTESSLPLVDLAALSRSEAEDERLARMAAVRPFDLERGPLLRTILVRLGPDRHLLLLALHHLVSDAWSMGVLIREVSALYRSPQSELLPLPLQYADFALWQRNSFHEESLEASLNWWRDRLSGAPPELELSADRPRPPVSGRRSGRGARHRLAFDRATAAGLEALARSEETTLFVALLAGFQALLQRWSGQEDVVVGAPFANRRRADVEGLIGFFVNTLPIRTDLSGRQSFRELLRQVKETVLGAHAHQDLPFERIVEALQPERAGGRNPLFQVVFAFQNVRLPALDLPGLELTLRQVDPGTAVFDLTLDLAEHTDGIQGWIETSADLFAPATAVRFAAQLQSLFSAVLRNPDVPCSELPVLAASERHQLVTEWNDRAVAVPRVSIQRLFEAQADLWPAAVAIEDGKRSRTYADLDARSNRLARYLRARGVGPEVSVAFCLERSIEAVETILAILKAGGAYVPLSPTYPAERLSWMLADSGARVLVTAPGTPIPPVPRGVAVVDLGRDANAIARRSASRLPDETDSDALAYVLYTSGSTGRPKGVAVTHRNVVRLVRGTDFAAFGPEEVWLLLAPLSFDASTLELWGPLLNGGRLSVFPSRVPSLEDLATTLEARGVTALWLTAGLFHQMVDLQPQALRSLRRLLAGGDVLSPPHVRRALREGIPLVNGYGPTEGTTFTCCHAMRSPDEAEDGGRISIGRPIANARAFVAGPGSIFEPALIGAPGELLAGGEGLARGYFGNPELTAERFVPDPFSRVFGGRLYRTGDRVRVLADGRLDFLGRIDRQVKIRGFRIEPGEVEAALTRHPAIADAVVDVMERGGDRRLVAYVVPVPGEPGPAAADLRRFLEPVLPAPLIPSDFVTLPELPRTVNDKVDRSALPVPMSSRVGAGWEPPRGVMEELLARLWEQVLEVHGIGAADGFFDLGGHSLLAVRLVSRIREIFEVELPLVDLFQAPTLRSLAARIKDLRRGENRAVGIAPLPAITALSAEGRKSPELSFAQERLWLFERMSPGTTVFHMPLGVRFRGGLDVAALARGFAEVVRRHEILRTAYPSADGRPLQRVDSPGKGSGLPLVDVEGLGDQAENEAHRLAVREALRPFDLEAEPPLRSLLIRTARHEHVVLVTLHHIAADGWSLEILVRELSVLYRAFAHRESSPLADLALQYADWAVWQRHWLQGEALEELRSAWDRLLAGAPTLLELPVDRPRGRQHHYRGAVRELSIEGELTHALEALSREEGCTLYMTVLAAFEILVRSFSGQDDFLIGSPVAGRGRGETEGMIGFFVNLLPLRASLRDGLTFRELLRQVRKETLDAWAHQEMPFDVLVRELRPVRDPARSPLFQVVFAWQETPAWDLELPGVATEILPPSIVPARYDLSLTVVRLQDRLELHLAYDADLFEADTAESLLRRCAALLRAIPETPDISVDRLESGGLEDLAVLRGPAAPIPAWCVHDRFEMQAGKSLHSQAVAFGSLSWSYADLAARVHRLARLLEQLGVGPEVRVGLGCQPGPAAVVGMLGILSAGGAWVPIDPDGPAERQAFFLNDSGARVLVTEPEFAGSVPFAGENIVIDPREDPGPDPGPVASRVLPENLAYVLYTSGSTGTPKGVAVEHRQLAAYLSFAERVLLADPARSCPFLTPLTFDACLKQALTPLLRGETVWAIEGGTRDLPQLLMELETRDGVAMNCTPTLWKEILAEIEPRGKASGIRRVLLGGERLSPELFARTSAVLPQAEVWNLYGPTETTANAAAGRLASAGPIVLGQPIDGARIYLFDRRLEPVPSGMPGEICVGGGGVSRGYLGQPALTAERFVPDPAGAPGGRLYRTGDLGRLGLDGQLVFLGRIDHQVKIHGVRVELGEIESQLERLPEVREAAVSVRDDRLTGYVVLERSGVDRGELRSALRGALPEPMIPAELLVLDRLPRLASGKVDRAALSGYGKDLSTSGCVLPRTLTELRLAEIWADVLDRESVSVEANFFELGGHSLQSIRISQRAAAAGLAISPRDLLQYPTVAELAAVVDARPGALLPPIPAFPLIQPDPERKDELFPLSEIQQAYLVGRNDLFELGGVGPTSYVEADWPELDVPRLEEAWRRLVERHEMLRAIAQPDGNWRILADVPRYRIGVLDLRGLEPSAARTELGLVREEMSSHGFQPERWPLFELLATVREDGRVRLHVARDLLVGDVRSNEILLEELLQLYRQPAAELPPLALSIRDYAFAVDALRESAAGRQARDYWAARRADLPPAPDLPLSAQASPPIFIRRHGEMDLAAWNRLTGRAARAGITPSVLLCAAFSEVLAAWSRGSRFTINVLYSRRLPLHPQVDRVVGNFASTILLEVDCQGADFEQRAMRLQERLWEDLRHGLVSGVEVLREMLSGEERPEPRSLRAAMPVVFSSALPFSRPHSDVPAESRPRLVFNSVQTPQVALEVLVTEASGVVRYTWNAVEDAFPSGFVAAMFESYGTLLRDLCASEESWHRQAVVRLPETQLIRRRQVNDTAAPEPGWLLHEPIVEQASHRPEAIAIAAPDRRLSYGELSNTADHLAAELHRLGARPGRLVGVVMTKGWEQIVAVLAILRAGAAYLPVDPDLPLERRRFLLEQGDVEIVLTQPSLTEALEWPVGVLLLAVKDTKDSKDVRDTRDTDKAEGSVSLMSLASLKSFTLHQCLAYVLFTSGSTGVPKGVMIEHRAVANTIADVNRRFGISAADRVLALSSLSFDLSVWDLFGVLGAGGRVVLPEPEASRDPDHWHQLIVREEVTVWNSVPALMELYAEYLEAHGLPMPQSLRLVLMSGDWIPIGLPDRLRALGAAEVVSLGGATEASIWSILYPIGEIDPAWRNIPYGRPMANQTFHVLNDRLDPCPDWVPGQLYIGGAGLARGYWKDEAKTQASFLLHPVTGERLYRTGDVGRWLPTGDVELLGREDLQVKIQGYRVELGEIEATLSRHPEVRGAAVAAVGEAKGHKRLVAYTVPASSREVEPAELRAWLEERLPEYMVPPLYVPLAALPLTPNGKLDRKALPSPETAHPSREDRFVAPRTPTEGRMASLWEAVLETSPVGLNDELFALGGDSMLALRLLAEIEKGFGCRLPLAAFFQEATVERLAAMVDASRDSTSVTAP